ncbi:NAD-dependent epimerase/dehydratase family protein [Seohaeicola zhoushanensis]|uniref:NAD-dependent epimerase/dehydratase domain-containing protein n=1 Tax=Seohaeicola zhoushanensis TaxID=1569283 RepID=A0A8J3GZI0_9RHOB|nr:NAD-dependent epimerase/dehydratase family protein [Seohaeicola zhoushanensis]GHF55614.1 hypothetical protein GCM10017056_28900 [Seohaeicola zhoushanensis]
MSRVLITGGAGFLGQRLARRLIASGELTDSQGRRSRIESICLADIAPAALPASGALRVESRQGDLSDAAFVAALAGEGFDSIFHLASFLTLQAEQDPARAYAVNVESLRRLIDAAANRPKVVFTSSIAIFGGTLPEEVGDDLNPVPTTTYGVHKAINELLIADYSRHGRIDGRSLRLPIVLIRPGAPQPAVSDRVAAIAREPMNGADIASPLPADMPIPVVSVGRVVEGLVRLHEAPADRLPPKRALNLPALTVTGAEMQAAVARMGGTGRITFDPDRAMSDIVAGWPRRFVSSLASALGIAPDDSFDAIIADYLANGG